MLSKDKRIPSSELPDIIKTGKRFECNSCLVVYKKNDVSVSRFAVVVKKTVDKHATARNKIKRTIREALRKLIQQTCPGYDIVLFANKRTSTLSVSDVREDLVKHFKNLSILH